MLNEAMGQPTTVNGVQAIETARGRRGHARFGPYESLDPGHYTVEFFIESVDGGGGSGTCAIVDVVADHGQRDIAFAPVLLSETVDNRRICLDFDLADQASLEYRVDVNGRAALRILDHAVVTPRTGDGAAPFEAIPPSMVSPPKPVPFFSTLCQQAHFCYDHIVSGQTR